MSSIVPDYYNANGVSVIDFIDAYGLNFNLGNVIKYIARAGHKNGEDRITALYKAYYYLQHQIALDENNNL